MRIVAAEIPQHRDHLAVALAIAAAGALAIAFLVVMLPPRPDRLPFLERARLIRVEAVAEGGRRRALSPVLLDDASLDATIPDDSSLAPSLLAPSLQAPSSLASLAPSPAFICRAPDRAAVRTWFRERVTPLMSACAERAPPGPTRGAVTLWFDEVGLIKRAQITGGSEPFRACVTPKLARLAHPDAFSLSFTWPFVIER